MNVLNQSTRARTGRYLLLPLGLLSIWNIANAHPGDFDNPFGSNGIAPAYSSLSTPVISGQLAIDQTNRKIFSGRQFPFGNVMIGAMDNAGNLDATFGSSGYVTMTNWVSDIKVDSHNRIVLAQSNLSVPGALITRLLSDGSPDTSFGTGGDVSIPYTDSGAQISLAIAADDSIYCSGSESLASDDLMLVAKLDNSGNLDTSFGGYGIAEVKLMPAISEHTFSAAMAMDNTGRIALGGYSILTDGSHVTTIAVLASDGALDVSFGAGSGFIQTTLFPGASGPTATEPTSVAFDSHGRLAVSLLADDYAFSTSPYVALLDSDGEMNSSFNGGDPLQISWAGIPENLLVDGRDRIIFATDTANSIVYRINEDGTLDNSFGDGYGERILPNLNTGRLAISHGGFITVFGASVVDSPAIDQLIGYEMKIGAPSGFFSLIEHNQRTPGHFYGL